MKRAMIGGFLSLTGSIWALGVMLCANDYPIDGWTTPPGRLLTQISEARLMLLFAVSAALTVLGIALMATAYSHKDGEGR